jgi:hypothetical protein
MSDDADAAWAARRALHEGAQPSLARIAEACRLSPRKLELRAGREGWRAAEADTAVAARVRRARLRLLSRIEAKLEEIDEATAEGNGASIAELTAVARTLERFGDDTRGEDRAKENQAERHATIARALERLDRKVVELATHLAEEMARKHLH